MTGTPTSTPSFGGHFFAGNTPIYFGPEDEGGAGGGEGGGEPVVTETAPVVEGGGTAPVVEGTAPVVEGGAPVVTAPVVKPESIPDPDDGTIPEALRPYVKQLRDEAAERRVALKPYEDVFGQLDAEESEALLAVIGGLVNEDTSYEAATQLKAIVESILGDGNDDPNRPLTRADLDRLEKERTHQAEQEAAVQAVLTEAKELGYTEGTREQRRLLDLAVNETGGDLKKAHEAIQAERDAVIADFAKQVLDGKAKWPTIAPVTGAPPADPSGDQPKTWAEARAASAARRQAAYGAS